MDLWNCGTQSSATWYEPATVIEINRALVVWYSNMSRIIFTPDRYVFCYILPSRTRQHGIFDINFRPLPKLPSKKGKCTGSETENTERGCAAVMPFALVVADYNPLVL